MLATNVLDRLLAMAGAEHRSAHLDQGLQLLGANLGRTAAEASVGGLEVGGDDRCGGHRFFLFLHLCSVLP